MYTSLNICQRFTRLIDTHEDEEIPAIKEEFTYLYASKTSLNSTPKEKYATLQNKRFCYKSFDEKSKIFYSIAMKYHRQAEDVLLSDNSAPNMASITKYITDLLTIHRNIQLQRATINNTVDNEGLINLSIYKNSILKFTELSINELQKLTAGLINKQQDSSIRSYFHLMLDIYWLFLTMNKNVGDNENRENKIKEITDLMQEIHFVMYKCYEKLKKYTIICPCVKVFWLRVELFCEEEGLNFWELFNTSMACYDEEFSLFTLKFLANLQCYSIDGVFIGAHCHRVQENVEFFNKKWSFLMKNSMETFNDNKVVRVLLEVEDLLIDLWLGQGKLEFYYLTWDYYYRRLEQVDLDGAGAKSFQQVLMQVERSDKSYDCNGKVNGYVIFLRMLKKHLGRHRHHWNKFKGRIYTKFPPVKFGKLSDVGLRNLALLFFALGSVNFEEISAKFLGMMKDLPGNKQNTEGSWNIYIFMIKQHLDNQLPITPVHTVFNPLLEESSRNRNSFALLTLFSNNLSSYFRVEDLTLKQSLLIGPWLENYIKSCSHNELISLLNTLSMVIERTVDAGVWYEYQNAFITYILNPLKRLTINQSIIGTVSGLIVANSEGLEDTIEYFVSENVPGDVMLSFFMTLRRKSTFTSNEKREFLTLKAWFLSEFIGVENPGFTEEVFQLLKVRFRNFQNDSQDVKIFDQFLQHVDKQTILGCLKDSDKFFAKNLNLNVYTNMALVFHYCGHHLYHRTSSQCYLSSFMDQFLLPIEVLRGAKPQFVQFVEKTWHLFMFSLWKLNSDESPYLERLLKDLTLRYIPHFSSKPTVLVKLTNNFELCDFVFGKIASEYFEDKKSKHIGDEALFKALNCVNTVLDDLLFDGVHKKELIVLFAKRFLLVLFEVYMFKNHKVIVVDIIKKLAALRGGNSVIRLCFSESLRGVMKKHLAFGTNQFFQMMYVMVKIVGDVVQGLLKVIKDEIAILECKRGQGFDNHLRQSYDKLVKLC